MAIVRNDSMELHLNNYCEHPSEIANKSLIANRDSDSHSVPINLCKSRMSFCKPEHWWVSRSPLFQVRQVAARYHSPQRKSTPERGGLEEEHPPHTARPLARQGPGCFVHN